MRRLDGRLSMWIVAVAACLAVSSWEFPTGADGAAMLATAESLLDRATLSIDPRFTADDRVSPSARLGPDGRAYSKYGIGLSVVELPFLVIARASTSIMTCGASRARATALSLINPLLTAFTVVLLFETCNRAGASRRASRFAALSYGLATPALVYATYDDSEALQASVIAVAILTFVTWERQRSDRALWACGVALAFGVLTKLTLLVIAPSFVLAIWLVSRAGGRRVVAARDLAKFVVPIGIAIAITMWLNWARFGSVLVTGYNTPVLTHPVGAGLYGLLLGPNKGLIVYVPLALLAPVGLMFARSPGTTAVITVGSAAWIVVNAKFYEWGGGWVWGPRYLYPILPLLFVAVAIAADRVHAHVTRTLCAIGIMVNVLGVVVDEGAYRRTTLHVWLPDETGLVRAGAGASGQSIDVPRNVEDVIPVFSSIAGHWWLARVALQPCDCSATSLKCGCRAGDFASNPAFLAPPWSTRFPEIVPLPPFGATLVWPKSLRALYRRFLFDPDRPT